MRVHPTAVKLIAWQGLAEPQLGGPARRLSAEETEQMTADHFEYDEIDRDEYTDCEVETHEDDVEADDRKNEDASREEPEVIAPGYGVVVKPKNDKPYVAEVLKERKATLEAARLTRDADRSQVAAS